MTNQRTHHLQLAHAVLDWNQRHLNRHTTLSREQVAECFAEQFVVEPNGRHYAADLESYREFLELLAGLIHPLLRDAGRPADPTLCQHYAIALNGLLDGLWLEGALGHGLYNPASLPGIALASAEGILGLAPGSLARHAAIPPS